MFYTSMHGNPTESHSIGNPVDAAAVTFACAQEPSTLPTTGALDAIEAERGGRHWVDAKTDPPKSPDDSQASLQIEKGYRIELFAAEPLVKDPVAIAFDRRGRMFVMEYGDYPIGPPEGQDPLSKIVLLDDTDGDGIADRRTVFADKLDFANSLMAYKDGLLVGAKTKILFLKDTDGDDVADLRESLFDGFEPAHPQMQISNPRWGIDNWIYLNYGPGKVASKRNPEQRVAIPNKDFRFHPETMQFGPDSGLGQYGNTIDRWGNRFYCTNRNPIITTFLMPEVLGRNPFQVVAAPFYDVGKAGGATVVFPLVEMKSNYLSHAGTHTAACGTTAYLGEFGDIGFRNSVFVCEPIGHLVTRSIVGHEGLHLKARRAEPKRDFIASTDSWFRPSSLASGPDGAIYLADMYRLWVEHPKFLPPEIAAKLDWRAGDDRGRIYRILPSDAECRPFEPPVSVADSVALLADPNGWRQFLGQRLLVEQQAKEATGLVRDLLHQDNATTRLHAIWTLRGLASLEPADVVLAIKDANPYVRVSGIELGRRWLDQPAVFHAVSESIDDPEIRVRLQIALTLSASESAEATELLCQLARRDGHDPAFADGLLTSTRNRSCAILSSLVSSGDADVQMIDLVKRLASVVGARGDFNELKTLLELISADGADRKQESDSWRIAAISGLGQGLPRYRGEMGQLTLAKLITSPVDGLADSVAGLKNLLEDFQQIAADPGRDPADRTTAVELLAYQPFETSGPKFAALLSGDQPASVQTACINALVRNGSQPAAEIVLEKWNELRPAIRGQALGFLLRRTETTRLALEAMAAEKMDHLGLNIDQRVLLLSHSDAGIRELAVKLFGGVVSPNRRQVVKDFEPALSLNGSTTDGKRVFTRVCASCHRRDGDGHLVGPDLSDVRNRSKSTLLYEILDPNAKVEPQFGSYSILTVDGQLFNGLIASETADAVVLTMAEGRQQTIGRAEIDQMKVSNVSLMPEGIEKDITIQQMADLLQYLKSE